MKGVPIDDNGNEIKYENELQYYHECQHCKQLVDRRDLYQVMHHMQIIHWQIKD